MDKDLPGTWLADERCRIDADVAVMHRNRYPRQQIHDSTQGQIRRVAASPLAAGNWQALLSNARLAASLSHASICAMAAR